MSQDFLTDPLWYKDAIIYELHVRSFFDANNDGYGDFEGMRRKLPYLESLGINTLWLLPFLESPLRDDGYDTADYLKILPVHGTLDDFRAFLDEAHERGMRVITELVLNHTSDQHPWFQEARHPGSPRHDWYVWSDTPEKYTDARIIFTDTEVSNWTWDRTAQQYYWHRFFSHQPDLNYDNPEVHAAMKEVLFFWLDMGVDGLRLDAVPYLYEREGTNCENLPETIEYVISLRQAIDARYGPGRVLLAEANQWPEDTLPYFGNGKGVQMAFNFPIMPRMYMALRRENRRPLIEMLELTEEIPDDAQWALFLRNHDELTLEMVTDEERDYMYHEYATDNRFRINVGIRRRLAPLLGGERRRIELMNALLLSLKGSPILYYGDEIGMGDDPFLGDRNGVRTPMQWSADKNGGFSRAPHHKLFMPPINRGPYSYEFINVEDAEANPHSLLHFTRRILTLRKQHESVFGRGTFHLIPVENQSILAFLREYEGTQILVIANLSRFTQSTFLPPSERYSGLVPVEMFSQNTFPRLADHPYHLLIGPHGFYWFVLKMEEELQKAQQPAEVPELLAARTDLPVLRVAEGLQNLLITTLVRDEGMERLEKILPDFVRQQRWFGAKDQEIRHVKIRDAVRLQARPVPVYLAAIRVEMTEGAAGYLLPLMVSRGDEAERILAERPQTAIAWIRYPDAREHGLLHDAIASPDFWKSLFRWWHSGSKARSLKGLYVPTMHAEAQHAIETVRIFGGEQSNSSALLDDRFYVKLYRRLERGVNPETELLDHLTKVGFQFVPQLQGTLLFKRPDRSFVLGIMQEALPVDVDGWEYALEMTRRFLERVAGTIPPDEAEAPFKTGNEVPAWLEDVASEMLSLVRVLGIRTAEMHRALARAEAPGMRPERGTPAAMAAFLATVREEAEQTRPMLAGHDLEETAWQRMFDLLDRLDAPASPCPRIRVHGDYHLGQIVRSTEGEFYILDFEGEPARSIEARRALDCPLRDVAGMLRSLEYAAFAAWRTYESDHLDERHANALLDWTLRLIHWCEHLFQDAYFATATDADFLPRPEGRKDLLRAYLLHKALYEVRYEVSHRPDWVWLPLRGLRRLLADASQDQPVAAPGIPSHNGSPRTIPQSTS